jgi:hypothetical protein
MKKYGGVETQLLALQVVIFIEYKHLI